MSLFFFLLLSVVCTEALTEIVVKSVLFSWPRAKLENIVGINKAISCPHCFSVWAAAFVVILVFFSFGPHIPWYSLGLVVLLVHRLSNYLHMFVDRVLDKFYVPLLRGRK